MDIILDVVDSMSNTPLQGATISLNGTAVGQTDSNGVFELICDDSDQITISYVGFSPYKIAAGIIEGTAQIQLARSSDPLPTVTVTPSPKTDQVLPALAILGGLIVVFSGSGKKVGATSKGKTSLLIGAGALGLGAVYLATRPKTTAIAPTGIPLTTSQMVANKASSNPLSSLANLFPSLTNIFSSGSPAPGTPGSFTPVSVDTSNATSPDDISPSFDYDTVNPDSSLNLDFSAAPVSGIGAKYTGQKFAGLGARYNLPKVRLPMSNLGDTDDEDFPARRKKWSRGLGDSDDDIDLPQKNRIQPISLGSIPMLLPYAAAAVGCVALLSKKKSVGKSDYAGYIIPVAVVGVGIYILNQTGLFGNSANAQNNNSIATGTASSLNASIATEVANGGGATYSPSDYQGFSNDIYNNLQSGTPNQDQVVRDVIQANTLLDWLYVKQAFGTKSFNTGSWLSLCAIAQVNCTTLDLDAALKTSLDATHIATINNYFSSQGINYSL